MKTTPRPIAPNLIPLNQCRISYNTFYTSYGDTQIIAQLSVMLRCEINTRVDAPDQQAERAVVKIHAGVRNGKIIMGLYRRFGAEMKQCYKMLGGLAYLVTPVQDKTRELIFHLTIYDSRSPRTMDAEILLTNPTRDEILHMLTSGMLQLEIIAKQLFDAEKDDRTIVRGLFTFVDGLIAIDHILDSQGVPVPPLVKRLEGIAGRSPQ